MTQTSTETDNGASITALFAELAAVDRRLQERNTTIRRLSEESMEDIALRRTIELRLESAVLADRTALESRCDQLHSEYEAAHQTLVAAHDAAEKRLLNELDRMTKLRDRDVAKLRSELDDALRTISTLQATLDSQQSSAATVLVSRAVTRQMELLTVGTENAVESKTQEYIGGTAGSLTVSSCRGGDPRMRLHEAEQQTYAARLAMFAEKARADTALAELAQLKQQLETLPAAVDHANSNNGEAECQHGTVASRKASSCDQTAERDATIESIDRSTLQGRPHNSRPSASTILAVDSLSNSPERDAAGHEKGREHNLSSIADRSTSTPVSNATEATRQRSGSSSLGFVLGNRRQLIGQQGIEVLDVRRDSPAQRAGIQKYDFLMELGNKRLLQLRDVADVVRALISKYEGGQLPRTVMLPFECLRLDNFSSHASDEGSRELRKSSWRGAMSLDLQELAVGPFNVRRSHFVANPAELSQVWETGSEGSHR